MPADILLYAIIAVVLIFWLKSTLGTRDEDDRQRPNPFDNIDEANKQPATPFLGDDGHTMQSVLPDDERYKKLVAEVIESKTAEVGIESIAKADSGFELSSFIETAKDVFVMVVEGFAKGDKDMLKMLLSPSVYTAFERVIDERLDKGEKVDTEIRAIREAHIIDAHMDGRMARITVRFNAEEICVIRDAMDEILAGHPEKETQMIDVWVFERDTKSNNPGWLLTETRDDHEEEHKTPLPEAS